MVVYLLGTSHISAKSVAQIKKEISSLKYGVVAVELDVMRLQSLFSKVKSSISPMMIFQVGVFGYLFAVVGRIVQQHLGRVVGVMPGEEMKTAVLLCKRFSGIFLFWMGSFKCFINILIVIPGKTFCMQDP